MRRWNGWGETSVTYPLHPVARAFLKTHLGPGTPPRDVSLAEMVQRVPPSPLPSHPLLTTDPEQRLRHALGQGFPDWVAARFGTLTTFPDAVAFPTSNEDVQALIAYAREVGARLLPYGGGTSVVGHLRIAPERRPVVVVAMNRMSRLLRLDAETHLATFQAGVRGPDLEAALRAQGFTLGHFPQSFEYSTLGGWIATRSVGQESHRYGRIDQRFVGGRVETPLGPWILPPYPASAAGPDLRQVVLGSEGRLGVITEATVRISPLPRVQRFHAYFFPDLDHGLAALRTLAQEEVPADLLRLSTPAETRVLLALSGHPQITRWLERWLTWRGAGQERCLLIAAASGNEKDVRRTLRRVADIVRAYRGVVGPHRVAHEWARSRFRSPYLRNTLWEMGYGVDTVETAGTWDRVPALVHALEQALREGLADIGERVLAFSHLSHVYPHGSSVYTTFVFRLGPNAAETLARWEVLKSTASWTILAHGGTISHQHGVGADHAPYLEAEKGCIGLTLEAALFRAVDPEGLFQVRA